MKYEINCMPWRICAAAAVLMALAAPRAGADAIVKKDGSKVPGTSIAYKRVTQEYTLMADGVQMTFPRSQVDHVEVAKPPQYDQAAKLVTDGKLDEAIPLLKAMIDDYDMRQWDNEGRDLLGFVYMKKKDCANAVATYEALIKNTDKSRVKPDTQRRYWDAMVGAGKYEALTKELDDVIATGSRESAATAFLVRGDVRHAQKQTFDALMDYLHTAVLFEQVRETQPEALYKAAEVLDELKDPRAEEFRKRLQADYRDSKWAKMATEKSAP